MMRPSGINSGIPWHGHSFASLQDRPLQGRTLSSSKPKPHSLNAGPVVRQAKNAASTDNELSRLSAESAGKLLAVLATEQKGQ
jgi:hypothetical protein